MKSQFDWNDLSDPRHPRSPFNVYNPSSPWYKPEGRRDLSGQEIGTGIVVFLGFMFGLRILLEILRWSSTGIAFLVAIILILLWIVYRVHLGSNKTSISPSPRRRAFYPTPEKKDKLDLDPDL